MSTKTPPAHGTEARYQGTVTRPSCRCRTCTTGWTRAGQRRQLARLEGRPATIPAQPVTDHITTLRAAGMNTCDIAATAGVDTSTINSHAAGNHTTIRRATANKILAVHPGNHTWRTPATATRRRLQALYAIGYGSTTIAARTGLTPTGIDKILNGHVGSVAIHTHDTIAAAYRKLILAAGTSTRARRRAIANDWHGPLAWGDDINDPDALPEVDDTPAPNVGKRDPELAAEVHHLASFGTSTHEIAQRIGRTESYIREQLAGRRGPGWRQHLEEAA